MSPTTTTVPLGLARLACRTTRAMSSPTTGHCFLRVLDETRAFAEAVNLARE